MIIILASLCTVSWFCIAIGLAARLIFAYYQMDKWEERTMKFLFINMLVCIGTALLIGIIGIK